MCLLCLRTLRYRRVTGATVLLNLIADALLAVVVYGQSVVQSLLWLNLGVATNTRRPGGRMSAVPSCSVGGPALNCGECCAAVVKSTLCS